ncbi:TRAP transporter small permease [Thermodesulfobacteriota bacterium]
MKTLHFLARVFEKVTRWSISIANVILVVIMFLTATDVIGRYFFNSPVPGALEFQEFLMAILVAMTIGYCAFKKGHINVDIMFIWLPKRVQTVLNLFHYLIGAGLFALVCWRTAIEAIAVQGRGLTSSIVPIPIFPFYWVVAFGCALLSIVWLYNAFESLSQMR